MRITNSWCDIRLGKDPWLARDPGTKQDIPIPMPVIISLSRLGLCLFAKPFQLFWYPRGRAYWFMPHILLNGYRMTPRFTWKPGR